VAADLQGPHGFLCGPAGNRQRAIVSYARIVREIKRMELVAPESVSAG
jgi:hypothetical protein